MNRRFAPTAALALWISNAASAASAMIRLHNRISTVRLMAPLAVFSVFSVLVVSVVSGCRPSPDQSASAPSPAPSAASAEPVSTDPQPEVAKDEADSAPAAPLDASSKAETRAYFDKFVEISDKYDTALDDVQAGMKEWLADHSVRQTDKWQTRMATSVADLQTAGEEWQNITPVPESCANLDALQVKQGEIAVLVAKAYTRFLDEGGVDSMNAANDQMEAFGEVGKKILAEVTAINQRME